MQALLLLDRVGHLAHGVPAPSEHAGGLPDASGVGHDGSADALPPGRCSPGREFVAGEPAESQGRNGQPKPASTSLFEWALALEQEQEQEKELAGAGRWAGMKGGRPAPLARWPPPVRPCMRPFFRFWPCGLEPLHRRAASVGEQMAWSKAVSPGPAAPPDAGNGAALLPSTTTLRCGDRSRGDGQSPPTQAGLLLEALQPLREVSGKACGLFLYCVRCRGIWPFLPQDSCNLPPTAMSGPSGIPRKDGVRSASARSQSTRSPGGGRRSACPKAPAASPASHMHAGFFRCPLLARTADGRHQLVGQHPAVSGADGSVVATVLGGGVAGGVELHRRPAPIS